MPLSPEEIEGRRFVVSLRGYDKVEVDEFLKVVAEEVRELRRLAAKAHDRDSLFSDLGDQVACVARAAVDAAEAVRAEAERTAHAVKAAANQEAERLLERARAELAAALHLRLFPVRGAVAVETATATEPDTAIDEVVRRVAASNGSRDVGAVSLNGEPGTRVPDADDVSAG